MSIGRPVVHFLEEMVGIAPEDFPQADEDQLREFARLWDAVAAHLGDVEYNALASARAVETAWDGEAGRALGLAVTRYATDAKSGGVEAMAQGASTIAQYLRDQADAVQRAKIATWTMAAATLAMFVFGLGGIAARLVSFALKRALIDALKSALSRGARERMAQAAAEAAGNAADRSLAANFIRYAAPAVGGAVAWGLGPDTVAQGWGLATGNDGWVTFDGSGNPVLHNGWNWSETAQAATMAIIAVPLGMGAGWGLGKLGSLATDEFGALDTAVGQYALSAAESSANMAATLPVAQAITTGAPPTAEDFEKAATLGLGFGLAGGVGNFGKLLTGGDGPPADDGGGTPVATLPDTRPDGADMSTPADTAMPADTGTPADTATPADAGASADPGVAAAPVGTAAAADDGAASAASSNTGEAGTSTAQYAEVAPQPETLTAPVETPVTQPSASARDSAAAVADERAATSTSGDTEAPRRQSGDGGPDGPPDGSGPDHTTAQPSTPDEHATSTPAAETSTPASSPARPDSGAESGQPRGEVDGQSGAVIDAAPANRPTSPEATEQPTQAVPEPSGPVAAERRTAVDDETVSHAALDTHDSPPPQRESDAEPGRVGEDAASPPADNAESPRPNQQHPDVPQRSEHADAQADRPEDHDTAPSVEAPQEAHATADAPSRAEARDLEQLADARDADLARLRGAEIHQLYQGKLDGWGDLSPAEGRFLAIREAIRRITGKVLRPTQIEAALAMRDGDLADMYTGEGKTLVGALALGMTAPERNAVHFYTSSRDLAVKAYREYSELLEPLGVHVRLVDSSRAEAEPTEPTVFVGDVASFGWSAARGHPVPGDRAVVDEIDSVLLDQAEHRYVISDGESRRASWFTSWAVRRANDLAESGQFTDARLQSDQRLQMAMAARDKVEGRDYIVANVDGEDRIVIVNKVTGEPLVDPKTGLEQRWTELAQALEAKHGLPIRSDPAFKASVTTKELFDRYETVTGMSGTAKVAEREISDLYGLRQVVSVDRYNDGKLVLHVDRTFDTASEKLQALADETVADLVRSDGLPQLIAVEHNDEVATVAELVRQRLAEQGLLDKVEIQTVDAEKMVTFIGPDYGARMAEIWDRAGEPNVITIGNRVVGRGVDIKPVAETFRLGDVPEPGQRVFTVDGREAVDGGLMVHVGFRDSLSGRGDVQAINRAGRQGAPGDAKVYTSAEDGLFRGNPDVITSEYREAGGAQSKAVGDYLVAAAANAAAPTAQTQVDLDRAAAQLAAAETLLAPYASAYTAQVSTLQAQAQQRFAQSLQDTNASAESASTPPGDSGAVPGESAAPPVVHTQVEPLQQVGAAAPLGLANTFGRTEDNTPSIQRWTVSALSGSSAAKLAQDANVESITHVEGDRYEIHTGRTGAEPIPVRFVFGTPDVAGALASYRLPPNDVPLTTITVSHLLMNRTEVTRALTHEIAELAALLHGPEPGVADMLTPGSRPSASAVLSAHDQGRLGEEAVLDRLISETPGWQFWQLPRRKRLQAAYRDLVVNLGLDRDSEGSEVRRALVPVEVSDRILGLRPRIAARLAELADDHQSPIERLLPRAYRLAVASSAGFITWELAMFLRAFDARELIPAPVFLLLMRRSLKQLREQSAARREQGEPDGQSRAPGLPGPDLEARLVEVADQRGVPSDLRELLLRYAADLAVAERKAQQTNDVRLLAAYYRQLSTDLARWEFDHPELAEVLALGGLDPLSVPNLAMWQSLGPLDVVQRGIIAAVIGVAGDDRLGSLADPGLGAQDADRASLLHRAGNRADALAWAAFSPWLLRTSRRLFGANRALFLAPIMGVATTGPQDPATARLEAIERTRDALAQAGHDEPARAAARAAAVVAVRKAMVARYGRVMWPVLPGFELVLRVTLAVTEAGPGVTLDDPAADAEQFVDLALDPSRQALDELRHVVPGMWLRYQLYRARQALHGDEVVLDSPQVINPGTADRAWRPDRDVTQEIAREVDDLRQLWHIEPGVLDVRIVSSAEDLAEYGIDPGTRPKGVYLGERDVIVLAADQIENPGQTREILQHEVLHAGLWLLPAARLRLLLDLMRWVIDNWGEPWMAGVREVAGRQQAWTAGPEELFVQLAAFEQPARLLRDRVVLASTLVVVQGMRDEIMQALGTATRPVTRSGVVRFAEPDDASDEQPSDRGGQPPAKRDRLSIDDRTRHALAHWFVSFTEELVGKPADPQGAASVAEHAEAEAVALAGKWKQSWVNVVGVPPDAAIVTVIETDALEYAFTARLREVAYRAALADQRRRLVAASQEQGALGILARQYEVLRLELHLAIDELTADTVTASTELDMARSVEHVSSLAEQIRKLGQDWRAMGGQLLRESDEQTELELPRHWRPFWEAFNSVPVGPPEWHAALMRAVVRQLHQDPDQWLLAMYARKAPDRTEAARAFLRNWYGSPTAPRPRVANAVREVGGRPAPRDDDATPLKVLEVEFGARFQALPAGGGLSVLERTMRVAGPNSSAVIYHPDKQLTVALYTEHDGFAFWRGQHKIEHDVAGADAVSAFVLDAEWAPVAIEDDGQVLPRGSGNALPPTDRYAPSHADFVRWVQDLARAAMPPPLVPDPGQRLIGLIAQALLGNTDSAITDALLDAVRARHGDSPYFDDYFRWAGRVVADALTKSIARQPTDEIAALAEARTITHRALYGRDEVARDAGSLFAALEAELAPSDVDAPDATAPQPDVVASEPWRRQLIEAILNALTERPEAGANASAPSLAAAIDSALQEHYGDGLHDGHRRWAADALGEFAEASPEIPADHAAAVAIEIVRRMLDGFAELERDAIDKIRRAAIEQTVDSVDQARDAFGRLLHYWPIPPSDQHIHEMFRQVATWPEVLEMGSLLHDRLRYFLDWESAIRGDEAAHLDAVRRHADAVLRVLGIDPRVVRAEVHPYVPEHVLAVPRGVWAAAWLQGQRDGPAILGLAADRIGQDGDVRDDVTRTVMHELGHWVWWAARLSAKQRAPLNGLMLWLIAYQSRPEFQPLWEKLGLPPLDPTPEHMDELFALLAERFSPGAAAAASAPAWVITMWKQLLFHEGLQDLRHATEPVPLPKVLKLRSEQPSVGRPDESAVSGGVWQVARLTELAERLPQSFDLSERADVRELRDLLTRSADDIAEALAWPITLLAWRVGHYSSLLRAWQRQNPRTARILGLSRFDPLGTSTLTAPRPDVTHPLSRLERAIIAAALRKGMSGLELHAVLQYVDESTWDPRSGYPYCVSLLDHASEKFVDVLRTAKRQRLSSRVPVGPHVYRLPGAIDDTPSRVTDGAAHRREVRQAAARLRSTYQLNPWQVGLRVVESVEDLPDDVHASPGTDGVFVGRAGDQYERPTIYVLTQNVVPGRIAADLEGVLRHELLHWALRRLPEEQAQRWLNFAGNLSQHGPDPEWQPFFTAYGLDGTQLPDDPEELLARLAEKPTTPRNLYARHAAAQQYAAVQEVTLLNEAVADAASATMTLGRQAPITYPGEVEFRPADNAESAGGGVSTVRPLEQSLAAARDELALYPESPDEARTALQAMATALDTPTPGRLRTAAAAVRSAAVWRAPASVGVAMLALVPAAENAAEQVAAERAAAEQAAQADEQTADHADEDVVETDPALERALADLPALAADSGVQQIERVGPRTLLVRAHDGRSFPIRINRGELPRHDAVTRRAPDTDQLAYVLTLAERETPRRRFRRPLHLDAARAADRDTELLAAQIAQVAGPARQNGPARRTGSALLGRSYEVAATPNFDDVATIAALRVRGRLAESPGDGTRLARQRLRELQQGLLSAGLAQHSPNRGARFERLAEHGYDDVISLAVRHGDMPIPPDEQPPPVDSAMAAQLVGGLGATPTPTPGIFTVPVEGGHTFSWTVVVPDGDTLPQRPAADEVSYLPGTWERDEARLQLAGVRERLIEEHRRAFRVAVQTYGPVFSADGFAAVLARVRRRDRQLLSWQALGALTGATPTLGLVDYETVGWLRAFQQDNPTLTPDSRRRLMEMLNQNGLLRSSPDYPRKIDALRIADAKLARWVERSTSWRGYRPHPHPLPEPGIEASRAGIPVFDEAVGLAALRRVVAELGYVTADGDPMLQIAKHGPRITVSTPQGHELYSLSVRPDVSLAPRQLEIEHGTDGDVLLFAPGLDAQRGVAGVAAALLRGADAGLVANPVVGASRFPLDELAMLAVRRDQLATTTDRKVRRALCGDEYAHYAQLHAQGHDLRELPAALRPTRAQQRYARRAIGQPDMEARTRAAIEAGQGEPSRLNRRVAIFSGFALDGALLGSVSAVLGVIYGGPLWRAVVAVVYGAGVGLAMCYREWSIARKAERQLWAERGTLDPTPDAQAGRLAEQKRRRLLGIVRPLLGPMVALPDSPPSSEHTNPDAAVAKPGATHRPSFVNQLRNGSAYGAALLTQAVVFVGVGAGAWALAATGVATAVWTWILNAAAAPRYTREQNANRRRNSRFDEIREWGRRQLTATLAARRLHHGLRHLLDASPIDVTPDHRERITAAGRVIDQRLADLERSAQVFGRRPGRSVNRRQNQWLRWRDPFLANVLGGLIGWAFGLDIAAALQLANGVVLGTWLGAWVESQFAGAMLDPTTDRRSAQDIHAARLRLHDDEQRRYSSDLDAGWRALQNSHPQGASPQSRPLVPGESLGQLVLPEATAPFRPDVPETMLRTAVVPAAVLLTTATSFGLAAAGFAPTSAQWAQVVTGAVLQAGQSFTGTIGMVWPNAALSQGQSNQTLHRWYKEPLLDSQAERAAHEQFWREVNGGLDEGPATPTDPTPTGPSAAPEDHDQQQVGAPQIIGLVDRQLRYEPIGNLLVGLHGSAFAAAAGLQIRHVAANLYVADQDGRETAFAVAIAGPDEHRQHGSIVHSQDGIPIIIVIAPRGLSPADVSRALDMPAAEPAVPIQDAVDQARREAHAVATQLVITQDNLPESDRTADVRVTVDAVAQARDLTQYGIPVSEEPVDAVCLEFADGATKIVVVAGVRDPRTAAGEQLLAHYGAHLLGNGSRLDWDDVDRWAVREPSRPVEDRWTRFAKVLAQAGLPAPDTRAELENAFDLINQPHRHSRVLRPPDVSSVVEGGTGRIPGTALHAHGRQRPAPVQTLEAVQAGHDQILDVLGPRGVVELIIKPTRPRTATVQVIGESGARIDVGLHVTGEGMENAGPAWWARRPGTIEWATIELSDRISSDSDWRSVNLVPSVMADELAQIVAAFLGHSADAVRWSGREAQLRVLVEQARSAGPIRFRPVRRLLRQLMEHLGTEAGGTPLTVPSQLAPELAHAVAAVAPPRRLLRFGDWAVRKTRYPLPRTDVAALSATAGFVRSFNAQDWDLHRALGTSHVTGELGADRYQVRTADRLRYDLTVETGTADAAVTAHPVGADGLRVIISAAGPAGVDVERGIADAVARHQEGLRRRYGKPSPLVENFLRTLMEQYATLPGEKRRADFRREQPLVRRMVEVVGTSVDGLLIRDSAKQRDVRNLELAARAMRHDVAPDAAGLLAQLANLLAQRQQAPTFAQRRVAAWQFAALARQLNLVPGDDTSEVSPQTRQLRAVLPDDLADAVTLLTPSVRTVLARLVHYDVAWLPGIPRYLSASTLDVVPAAAVAAWVTKSETVEVFDSFGVAHWTRNPTLWVGVFASAAAVAVARGFVDRWVAALDSKSFNRHFLSARASSAERLSVARATIIGRVLAFARTLRTMARDGTGRPGVPEIAQHPLADPENSTECGSTPRWTYVLRHALPPFVAALGVTTLIPLGLAWASVFSYWAAFAMAATIGVGGVLWFRTRSDNAQKRMLEHDTRWSEFVSLTDNITLAKQVWDHLTRYEDSLRSALGSTSDAADRTSEFVPPAVPDPPAPNERRTVPRRLDYVVRELALGVAQFARLLAEQVALHGMHALAGGLTLGVRGLGASPASALAENAVMRHDRKRYFEYRNDLFELDRRDTEALRSQAAAARLQELDRIALAVDDVLRARGFVLAPRDTSAAPSDTGDGVPAKPSWDPVRRPAALGTVTPVGHALLSSVGSAAAVGIAWLTLRLGWTTDPLVFHVAVATAPVTVIFGTFSRWLLRVWWLRGNKRAMREFLQDASAKERREIDALAALASEALAELDPLHAASAEAVPTSPANLDEFITVERRRILEHPEGNTAAGYQQTAPRRVLLDELSRLETERVRVTADAERTGQVGVLSELLLRTSSTVGEYATQLRQAGLDAGAVLAFDPLSGSRLGATRAEAIPGGGIAVEQHALIAAKIEQVSPDRYGRQALAQLLRTAPAGALLGELAEWLVYKLELARPVPWRRKLRDNPNRRAARARSTFCRALAEEQVPGQAT